MRDIPAPELSGLDKASTQPNRNQPVPDIEALAWTYSQKSGHFQQHDLQQDDLQQSGQQQDDFPKNGQPAAVGYSGAGAGKNNPDMQNVANVGPIPQGEWTISGPPFDSPDHGPYVLRLQPAPETKTFGRSGFLMHGDSKEHPGSASHGCIVVPRAVREKVWNSGDHDLKVVADSQPVAPNSKEKS